MICRNYSLALVLLFMAVFSSKAQHREPEEKDKVEILYPQAAFDSLEAKKMLSKGSATIKGVAFTKPKTKLGYSAPFAPRIYADKITVYLFPVTPYFEEWYRLRKAKENTKKKRFVHLSKEASQYRIEAITNSDGKFTFPDMRPGNYFLQAILGYTFNGTYNSYAGSGYGSYGNVTDYYVRKSYSVDHEDRIEEFVEIKTDGEIVHMKLK